ncbi:hypothetical protein JCM12178A_23650 [Salidesulfovibrio brasiliensis]
MVLAVNGNRDDAAAQRPEFSIKRFGFALINKFGKQAVSYDGKSFHEATIIQFENEV